MVALIVAAVLCAGWMQWMVQMSGGWWSYRQALHHIVEYQSGKTVVGGGWDALGWNVFFTALFCWNGLILGVPLFAGALVYRVFGADSTGMHEWDRRNRTAIHILWLWILPMMLLGSLVGYTESPGHVFTYLPGWLLVEAVIVAQLQKQGVYLVVMTAVCAANTVVFTAWPRNWDKVFWGNGRTAREIREHDEQVAQMVSAIHSQLKPEETVICHAREHLPLGLRHLQLYLPEFEQYQLAFDPAMLSPAGKPVMMVRDGRLEFVHGMDLTGMRVLALIVPKGTSLQDYAPYFDVRKAKPLPESGNSVYSLPIETKR
jgi:hypothetical protein